MVAVVTDLVRAQATVRAGPSPVRPCAAQGPTSSWRSGRDTVKRHADSPVSNETNESVRTFSYIVQGDTQPRAVASLTRDDRWRVKVGQFEVDDKVPS